ncbi:MAG: hypothetical protein Q8S03_12915 [Brevundimonas sp.]|uniref:hypothetical protein n=1 Tax=Brevundimonas sp. TaxID=1871086 RepID=UPI002733F593|nr:hypothetical protein [Brevundimonas sp.]MDP3405589.1 hypothetical protein [Brevundimonas sp.]
MDRTEVVASVAGDLYATERAIDDAITAATTLVQSMIGARALLKVSHVAGSTSQTKAMEAIAALSAAREAIVASHTEMQKDHRRMGWGTYAVGVLDKPDDDWAEEPPVRNSNHHVRNAAGPRRVA